MSRNTYERERSRERRKSIRDNGLVLLWRDGWWVVNLVAKKNVWILTRSTLILRSTIWNANYSGRIATRLLWWAVTFFLIVVYYSWESKCTATYTIINPGLQGYGDLIYSRGSQFWYKRITKERGWNLEILNLKWVHRSPPPQMKKLTVLS